MNPGKVVDPYLPDENLRLGPRLSARPSSRRTSSFPDDDGSFAYATVRCVGVGKCRKDAERHDVPELHGRRKEEMHSTRGRAHLLFEMLQGDPMKDGWQSERRARGARPLPGVQGLQERVPR